MEKILQHFKIVDPLLFDQIEKIGGLPTLKKSPSSKYFADLCDHIISQQLAGKAAAKIFERFESIFPEKVITPEEILTCDVAILKSVGLSNAKLNYLRFLSQAVVDGNLNLSQLDSLSNEDIIANLTLIKGIGSWTADMFLIFSLGREDVFSVGDLGLRNGIKKVYSFESPTKDEIIAITNNWAPYRSYGSLILWRSLAV